MEKGQLIETYRILQKCKLEGLKKETVFAILHNMNIMRPTVKEWEEGMRDAAERLQTEDVRKVIDNVRRHNEERTKMSEEEEREANAVYAPYAKQLEEYRRKELSEDMGKDLEGISEEELVTLVAGNSLTAREMEILSGLV